MTVSFPSAARNKGFTLIEMLVVIAIIALLAAIIFPVFASVREKARQASCASNLKQLGMGVLEYINDNDEENPPIEGYNEPGTYTTSYNGYYTCCAVGVSAGVTPTVPTFLYEQSPTAANAAVGWPDAIFPYVKNTQLFHCPDQSMGMYGSGTVAMAEASGGYAMNQAFVQSKIIGNAPMIQTGQDSEILLPSQLILLGEVFVPREYGLDTGPMDPGSGYSDMLAINESYTRNFMEMDPVTHVYDIDGTADFRHGYGSNYLFYDGHVKLLMNPFTYTSVSSDNTANRQGDANYWCPYAYTFKDAVGYNGCYLSDYN